MLVDFNRVFKNKTQTNLSVPKALVEYMNRSLPEGMKYVVDDKGNCVISSTNDKCTISGFKFVPNEEQRKILGKNFSIEDVLNYAYNIQRPVQLKFNKDGFILLNGKEISIEKMAFNPFAPIKYVSNSFYMLPPKFPDPFLIKVGNEKYEKTLQVKRVAHNSVSIKAFESDKNEPFYVKYFVDEKNQTIKMNFSLNISKSKTIRDIVESASIYNAFIEGKGTLLGRPLTVKVDNDSKKFDSNSIVFWEKVLKIEEYLEIQFVPPNDDVDFETMCLVEQLYQNIVNEVPTRKNEKIDSIDANWDFNYSKKKIEEVIGKPLLFKFQGTVCFELFGVTKELPCLVCVFNTILKRFTQKGKIQKIILDNENEEKKQYSSIMCFKTEENLKEYEINNHEDMVNGFKNAKKPSEYL